MKPNLGNKFKLTVSLDNWFLLRKIRMSNQKDQCPQEVVTEGYN